MLNQPHFFQLLVNIKCFLLFFLCPIVLTSQVKPDFFPEEILVGNDIIQCFCEPGVLHKRPSKGLSIIYGYSNSGSYEPEGGTQFANDPSILNRQERLEIKLKIPLIIKDRLRLLLGYKYYSENYDLQLIGEDFRSVFQMLDTEQFKNNEFSTILSYSLNDKNYIGFRYRYALNGNYDGWLDMDSRYAIHSFMGVYGIKKTDAFEWGVGMFLNKSFRRTTVLPFILYNRTFNFNWGIEALFPANIFLRHNLNNSTIASLGIEYGSKSFRVNSTGTGGIPFDYAFNHSELLTSLSLEKRLISWLWINGQVGFQKNFSNDFEGKLDTTPSFQAEPNNGLFFRVGLFLSPSQYF